MSKTEWRALGGLAAMVAVALVVWAATGGAFAPGPDGTGGWIYEYQSLIGGLAALIGAFAGAWILWRQIRLQQSNFREQMSVTTAEKRQLVAAAAALLRHRLSNATFNLGPNPNFGQIGQASGLVTDLLDTKAYAEVRFYVGEAGMTAFDNLIAVARRRAFHSPQVTSTRDEEGEFELLRAMEAASAELDRLGRRMQRGWT